MSYRRPLSILVKPTSSLCNLRCTYCFYLEKQAIYPWKDQPRLTIETFEIFCKQYAQVSAPNFSINWQGGEPTLMGLDFFREAMEVQTRTLGAARSAGPVQITNGLQTNGTLLDDEWARFLHEHRFLVGVSLDGPADWHDHYRFDAARRATHDRVLQGIERLRRHNVEFNVLTVVSRSNVEQPRELLRYLVDLDLHHLQFIPCVERLPADHPHAGKLSDFSITPEQYGQFLTDLFDEWLKIGYHKVRIRYFDNLLQMALGMPAEMCQLAYICGGYVVLEHNGDIYPCDFFVEPSWKLGNIHETPLSEIASREQFRGFGRAKADVHEECTRCTWRRLCYGECPRYRIINAGSHRELTYFCSSYKAFFSASWSRLAQVADEVGRVVAAQAGPGVPAIAGTMPQPQSVQLQPNPRSARPQVAMAPAPARGFRKVGRNDPCPCGSGRKYKRCHGA